jgi:hypothetical protein
MDGLDYARPPFMPVVERSRDHTLGEYDIIGIMHVNIFSSLLTTI